MTNKNDLSILTKKDMIYLLNNKDKTTQKIDDLKVLVRIIKENKLTF